MSEQSANISEQKKLDNSSPPFEWNYGGHTFISHTYSTYPLPRPLRSCSSMGFYDVLLCSRIMKRTLMSWASTRRDWLKVIIIHLKLWILFPYPSSLLIHIVLYTYRVSIYLFLWPGVLFRVASTATQCCLHVLKCAHILSLAKPLRSYQSLFSQCYAFGKAIWSRWGTNNTSSLSFFLSLSGLVELSSNFTVRSFQPRHCTPSSIRYKCGERP